jgi:(2R)-ethylmalonyl-CoA mutase
MPPSIACAKAGVTTGEWSARCAGFRRISRADGRGAIGAGAQRRTHRELREEVDAVASKKLGRRLTFLVAKPGLDGHSNGAEQIAIRARDAGMDVIYDGIRFTADEIVAAAARKRPHVIGLSILSGSHVPLARKTSWRKLRRRACRHQGCRRRHHSAGGRRTR